MIYRFRRACSTRGSTHSPWAALRCAATLEGMPEPRRAAGRLGRRFEMVRCEYAAPAFVIAGLDTEKSAHPAWSSPAVTGAGSRSCANKAAMTANTPNARPKRKARLHSFPVFVLFRPVISGKPHRPGRRRGAPVSCFHPGAYGEIAGARLCPASCFSAVIYRNPPARTELFG